MMFRELLHILPGAISIGQPPSGEIAGLAYDSRKVEPGMIFAALRGEAADGHAYVAGAAQAGATAALVERPVEEAGLWQVQVPDSRAALAKLAAKFFGNPSRSMTMVGITGTNGKTTTSYLIESVLARLGQTGVIGTVEARFAGQTLPAPMTTPESVELQALLADMRSAGVNQAVMEVSSHALEQHRADFVEFDAAVFTNLTRDHLDYHGDMETYLSAKLRLFRDLLPASRQAGKPAAAIVCLDGEYGQAVTRAVQEAGLTLWTYGFDAKAKVRGEDPALGLDGGSCRVVWPGGEFNARTSLVGHYNLQNLLAAATVGLSLGMPPEEIAAGLEACEGVPGRLQRVGGASARPAVFVDYAHTDDALTQVLAALKPLTKGRLICVFGAGGDRDHGKRPLMGLAVGKAADAAVLTSDNPRTEDPSAIMAMVEPGLKEAGLPRSETLQGCGLYVTEPDRAKAIALAIASANDDDVVLIAGKGHEDYQIVGREKCHFDDREQAAAALAGRIKGGDHASI
jgi:UDP-N-acetylmuramoyl-L-alanyl-D-glutamate--2,6-diaminopimelate ligase